MIYTINRRIAGFWHCEWAEEPETSVLVEALREAGFQLPDVTDEELDDMDCSDVWSYAEDEADAVYARHGVHLAEFSDVEQLLYDNEGEPTRFLRMD